MDLEDKWTEAIRQRQLGAFIPYAMRMWQYALATGLRPADAKQLKLDYANSFKYAQGAGLFAILYWNSIAMSTRPFIILFPGLG